MQSTNGTSEEQGKCQFVRFDSNGNLLDSNDALFEMPKMNGFKTDKKLPFLSGILRSLNKRGAFRHPLFIPDVEFEFGNYHSICDFTFMSTRDARGNKQTVWIIYDNSEHYRDLIQPGKKVLKKAATILKLKLL